MTCEHCAKTIEKRLSAIKGQFLNL
ncbi:MAG: heavy metal-associated domain-containing protein [Melioribacter sp.]|nr:heavy metal-associated domain-containing protein [Melioribacter sp.]